MNTLMRQSSKIAVFFCQFLSNSEFKQVENVWDFINCLFHILTFTNTLNKFLVV